MEKIEIKRGFTEIRRLWDLIQEAAPGQAWIAGGYAAYCASASDNPVTAGDVDVFPSCGRVFGALGIAFGEVGVPYRESERAVTYDLWDMDIQVQLIVPGTKQEWTPESLICDSDLTVCSAVLLSPYTALVDPLFCRDTRAMQIGVVRVINPIRTMMRLQKYIVKGYQVAPCEMVKVFDFYESLGTERHECLNEYEHMSMESWLSVGKDEKWRYEDEGYDDGDYEDYDEWDGY